MASAGNGTGGIYPLTPPFLPRKRGVGRGEVNQLVSNRVLRRRGEVYKSGQLFKEL
jgi:hypothetical protein